MKTYTVKKVQAAPNWETVPVMPIDTVCWDMGADISAQAQICWDENNLYLKLQAREAEIRMEETGETASPCEDSCLEFFFRPTDAMDYFNVEFNPNAALWLGYGSKDAYLIRLLVPDLDQAFKPEVTFTDDGWSVTYQIPFFFIRRFFPDFAPVEGSRMWANAYKCGDKTSVPHYFSWNPMSSETPAFHRPQDFGCVIFGGE